jgi:predicted ATPase
MDNIDTTKTITNFIGIYFENHHILGTNVISLSRKYDLRLTGTREISVTKSSIFFENHLEEFRDIVALVGNNGIGKSTSLKTFIDIFKSRTDIQYSIIIEQIFSENDRESNTDRKLVTLSYYGTIKEIRSIGVKIEKASSFNFHSQISSYTTSSTPMSLLGEDHFYDAEMSKNYSRFFNFLNSLKENNKELKEQIYENIPNQLLFFIDIDLNLENISYLKKKRIPDEWLNSLHKYLNNDNLSGFISKDRLDNKETYYIEINPHKLKNLLYKYTHLRDVDLSNRKQVERFQQHKMLIYSFTKVLFPTEGNDKYDDIMSRVILISEEYREDILNNKNVDPFNSSVINHINSFKYFLRDNAGSTYGILTKDEIKDIEKRIIDISELRNYNNGEYKEVKLRLAFLNSSSGEHHLVNLLSWFYNACNPENSNEKFYPLIILDEPDQHLHLDRQVNFIHLLVNILKASGTTPPHLIFTTHSPFLISDLTEDSIVYLSRHNEEVKIEKDLNKKVFMQNLHDICHDSFYLKDTFSSYSKSFFSNLVNKFKFEIASLKNNFNKQKYNTLLAKIDRIGEYTIRNMLRNEIISIKLEQSSRNKPDFLDFLTEIEKKYDSNKD